MAVAYRSSTTLAIGTRTNSSWTKPTGTASGDFLLIIMSAGNSAAVTVTPPTGFSTLGGTFLQAISKADPWTTRQYAFYRFADGTEGASFSTSHSSASTDGICYAWTGVDTGTPFSPTQTTNGGTTSAGGSGQSVTATGLTTTLDSSGIIFAAISWDGWTSTTAPTGTTPTFTERFDSGSTGNSYVADGVHSPAGATGNKSVTTTFSGANPWSAAHLALAPAGAGGGGATPRLGAGGPELFLPLWDQCGVF